MLYRNVWNLTKVWLTRFLWTFKARRFIICIALITKWWALWHVVIAGHSLRGIKMETEVKPLAQVFIMEASATRKLYEVKTSDKARQHAQRVLNWHKQTRYFNWIKAQALFSRLTEYWEMTLYILTNKVTGNILNRYYLTRELAKKDAGKKYVVRSFKTQASKTIHWHEWKRKIACIPSRLAIWSTMAWRARRRFDYWRYKRQARRLA